MWGWGHIGGETFYTTVSARLFWRTIYCTKPRPNTKFQSGPWYHRKLGGRAACMIQEQNLATVIEIQLFTQPNKFWMSYMGLSTTSWLEFESTARSTFLSIPYTERENGQNISVTHDIYYSAYHYFPFPNDTGDYPLAHTCKYPCQNLQIWRQLWNKYGFPIYLRWERHILSTSRPALTFLFIWHAADLLNERFTTYAFREEVLLSEVQVIIKHFLWRAVMVTQFL